MRTGKAVNVVLAVMALTLAAPPAVDAGKDKDAPAKLSRRKRKKLAKQYFKQAKRDFELGRFKDALAGFTKAYEILPHPGLLFNIGQCHRMLKTYKKAIFFYEGYLAAIPDAPNKDEVQRLVAESKRQLKDTEARKAEEARRKHEEAKRRLELQKAKLALEAKKAAPAPARPYVPKAPEDRPKPAPFYKKWWFWSAVGAGVAAVVATSLAVTMTRKTETVPPEGSAGTIDWR